MLREAERLIKLGFLVILLHKDSKRPFGNAWQEIRRDHDDPDKRPLTAEQLAKKFDQGHNIGVLLGEPSKIDGLYLQCIDVDIRDPARKDEALNRLREFLPDFEDYPTVLSGSSSGSRHVYFLSEEPFASRDLAHSKDEMIGTDGKKHWVWELELYGTGKQCVLPPSTHPDTGKAYRWLNEFTIDAPEIPSRQIKQWVNGLDHEEVNRDRRETPGDFLLESTRRVDLSYSEIQDVLEDLPDDWVDNYDDWLRVGHALHHQYEGSDKGLELWHWFSKPSGKYDPDVLDSKWRGFGKSTGEPVRLRSLIKVANRQRDRGERRRHNSESTLRSYGIADLASMPDAIDFVEGVLFEGQTSQLVGPPNVGKTFFALDLSMHVTAGRTWHGKKVLKSAVLYIALEGINSIKRRFWAWCKYHKIADPKSLPIGFASGLLNLRKDDDARDWIINEAKALAGATGLPIRLVVIDTQNRAMAGGNENSSEDMGALIAGIDYLRVKSGAHIMSLHHPGWEETERARGHSSQFGAVDTEILMKEGKARIIKQRDGPTGALFRFDLVKIEFEEADHWGNTITSRVAVENTEASFDDLTTDDEDVNDQRARGAMFVLRRLTSGISNTVTIDEWREALKKTNWPEPDMESAAFRMAFKRARDHLEENSKIRIDGENVGII